MFGVGKRIRNALARIKGLPFQVARNKKVLAILATIVTIGETTIDTQQMTELFTSLLPLLIMMISIAIPLMFFKYIMKFLEKILSSFG